MFDIGWAELFLIAAVALVVLGPKELPVVMRKLGRWAGMARRQAAAWQAQMEDVTAETPKEAPPKDESAKHD